MKITFELPADLVRELRSKISSAERSKFAADSISKTLQKRKSSLNQAAKKANRLRPVNDDMKAWEALNGYPNPRR